MQHHHRLAAARAALEHETFSLGTGDDFVLFFLDRFDDILDRGLFLAVFDDLPKIGIEENFLVPSADLLGREIVLDGQKLILEIQHLPVLGAQGAAQDRLIIVFVDGKGNAAFLIIFTREWRAPIDDFELDVPLFADVIAVVAFERVC